MIGYELGQIESRGSKWRWNARKRFNSKPESSRIDLRSWNLHKEPGDGLLVADAPVARLIGSILVIDQIGDFVEFKRRVLAPYKSSRYDEDRVVIANDETGRADGHSVDDAPLTKAQQTRDSGQAAPSVRLRL